MGEKRVTWFCVTGLASPILGVLLPDCFVNGLTQSSRRGTENTERIITDLSEFRAFPVPSVLIPPEK